MGSEPHAFDPRAKGAIEAARHRGQTEPDELFGVVDIVGGTMQHAWMPAPVAQAKRDSGELAQSDACVCCKHYLYVDSIDEHMCAGIFDYPVPTEPDAYCIAYSCDSSAQAAAREAANASKPRIDAMLELLASQYHSAAAVHRQLAEEPGDNIDAREHQRLAGIASRNARNAERDAGDWRASNAAQRRAKAG